MTNLFKNLLARYGRISLSKLDDEKCDDLEIVSRCVKNFGPGQFMYASDWLKSDADSILRLIEIEPAIINYCADVVYDRYVDQDFVVKEEEVDAIAFASKCVHASEYAFSCLPIKYAKPYYKAFLKKDPVTACFHGKPYEIDFNKNKYEVEFCAIFREDLREFLKYSDMSAGV